MDRRDMGGLVVGLIVILIGGYFVLDETFGIKMPDINWDQIWPLLIVAVGASILWNAWRRSIPPRQ